MATDSSQPREFHRFSKLPLEIRLEIWKLALSAPRVIGIALLPEKHLKFIKKENGSCPFFWTTNASSPQILHVSHEARDVGLTLYEPVSVWYRSNATWTRSYVDYDKDVFYFGDDSHSAILVRGNKFVKFVSDVPLTLGRLRYLCIRSANLCTWKKWGRRDSFFDFPCRKRRTIQYLISIFEALPGLAELQLAYAGTSRTLYMRYELVEPEGEISDTEREFNRLMLERIPGLVEGVAKKNSSVNIPSITMSSLVAMNVMNPESSNLAHPFDEQD